MFKHFFTPADTIFSRRPTPDHFYPTPGRNLKRWKQTRTLATTLPEFSKEAQFYPEVGASRTESAFISPVKYSALSLLTLTVGHLTHPRISPSLTFRHQNLQEALESPSAREMHRHHRGYFGLRPERGFPGQRARVHRGRGHFVGCRPGTCMCGPARSGGETLYPPGGKRGAICRIAESPKATFKFDDATATKFLMRPLFSGCTLVLCA